MIVAADRVPAAIIQHVATDVVLDALPDPVTVVSLGAHAPVAAFAGRNALRVHVTLGRIGRAIGHHAPAVHHAESRIARALVAGARRIVRASFVLQTVGAAAARVCVCVKTNASSSSRRTSFEKDGTAFLQEVIAVMLRVFSSRRTQGKKQEDVCGDGNVCDELKYRIVNDRGRMRERERNSEKKKKDMKDMRYDR